jgi:hypothetical protein
MTAAPLPRHFSLINIAHGRRPEIAVLGTRS